MFRTVIACMVCGYVSDERIVIVDVQTEFHKVLLQFNTQQTDSPMYNNIRSLSGNVISQKLYWKLYLITQHRGFPRFLMMIVVLDKSI